MKAIFIAITLLHLAILCPDSLLGETDYWIGANNKDDLKKLEATTGFPPPQWNALQNGLNSYAVCMAVHNGELYVGGDFQNAGGDPDADGLAKWDGCYWHSVAPGIDGQVLFILFDGDLMYVGGDFTVTQGSFTTDNIAFWDGTNWNALGSGINGSVWAIAKSGNNVYAGGSFLNSGGNPNEDNIARFDGTSWNAMGPGLNGPAPYGGTVFSIAVNGNNVYAGGWFENAGGNSAADHIALWNGSGWQALGSGFDSYVGDITIANNLVYATGGFTNYVAAWNGSAWNYFGTGPDIIWGDIEDINVQGSTIYIAAFQEGIWVWSGSSWQYFTSWPPPPSNEVWGIEFLDNDIYVCGEFQLSVQGTHNIARWGEPEPAIIIPGIDETFCELDPPYALPTTINNITGTWGGTGVINNIFYPLGLSGSVSIFFTPDPGPCFIVDESIVTVTPQTNILFTIPNTICENAGPISLPTIQSSISGYWSGPGVSGNLFSPANLSGDITLTFNPFANQCAAPTSTIIVVNPEILISISGIPDTVCQNSPPVPFPSTQSGVPGYWSGPGITNNTFYPSGLSGNISIIFLPSAACADPQSITLYVQVPVVPDIDGVPSVICETANPVVLPIIENGFWGNWSGPGVTNNIFYPDGMQGDNVIHFIPGAGQCATNASALIHVDSTVIPMITDLPGTVCESDTNIILSSIQDGIVGVWSGQGVSNNTFNPTGLSDSVILTFNPLPNQCALAVTSTIIINESINIIITGVPFSLCELSDPILLPDVQNGITGVWSGQGVANNTFNPNGLSDSVLLTFNPLPNLCALAVTSTIIINEPVNIIITGVPSFLCELSSPILLPDVQNGITGTWSGSGVNNNYFNPQGLSDTITLIFTPQANCTSLAQVTINVNDTIPVIIPDIPASWCQLDSAFELPLPQNSITGNWSGDGVINNVFYPSGLMGMDTIVFIPDINQCAEPISLPLNIVPPVIPVIADLPTGICQQASAILLPLVEDSISGSWFGTGVNGNEFSPTGLTGNIPISFIPDSGECAIPVTSPINIYGSPSYEDLVTSCDSLNATYQVSFDIVGGDSSTYTINGIPISGSTFTSMWTDNDSTSYSFLIDDQYGCEPILVSGNLDCTLTTDSKELDSDHRSLIVYPNPAHTVIHFIMENDDPSNCIMTLRSLSGEILITPESGESEMDISNLPNGVYFFRVLHGRKSEVVKIVKL